MSGGAAMQMAGSIFQGIASYASGQQQKKAYETAAINSLREGAAREARVRESVRAAVGNQIGAQWANGMEGGTGSALDAVHESLVQGALDALDVRAAAQNQSDTMKYKGDIAEQQGKFGLISGLLGAGASYAQGQQDWAVARQGSMSADVNRTIAANRGIF